MFIFFTSTVLAYSNFSFFIGGPYNRGVYGRTRISPAIAMAVLPPIIGVLVDYFTQMSETPDYTPTYFIMAACELLVCVLIFVLPLPVGGNTCRYDVSVAEYAPRTYIEETSKFLGLSLEMIILSIMATVCGAAWGLSQVSFFYWCQNIILLVS